MWILSPLLALGPLVLATTYPLIESWMGDGFMDGFNYDASAYDNTTNGDVFWATGANTSLMYVSDAKTVIMKVDNTTLVPYNEKRYAPKLLSKTAYEVGTVWVMDAVHAPYGCSVWGGYWTQGPAWPLGGEIDIFEGINQQATNQIALHTTGSGCLATSSSMTGRLTAPNCSIEANSGSGCTVLDPNENSYGAGFAAAGGGVYVTEFASDGIRMWFFTRSSVPSSLSSGAKTIDTSSLGTPVAEYLNSACDIGQYFGPQTLTIDITLCGDWAGVPALLEQTCPALAADQTCYTTYVINDASTTYANAYYEINYVNVYASSSGSNQTGSSTSSVSRLNAPTTTITAGAGTTSTLPAITGAASRLSSRVGFSGVFGVLAALGGILGLDVTW